MSKNDKLQQSYTDAAASPTRCVHKVLDTPRRFIDDCLPELSVGLSRTRRYRVAVLTESHSVSVGYLDPTLPRDGTD